MNKQLAVNTVTLTTLICLQALAISCESKEQRDRENAIFAEPSKTRTPTAPLPEIAVQPEWRDFALANYKECVKREVRSPATAQFEQPPVIAARYDSAKNDTSLTALGDVDAQNGFGALLRAQYVVIWRSPGKASPIGANWKLDRTLVGSAR